MFKATQQGGQDQWSQIRSGVPGLQALSRVPTTAVCRREAGCQARPVQDPPQPSGHAASSLPPPPAGAGAEQGWAGQSSCCPGSQVDHPQGLGTPDRPPGWRASRGAEALEACAAQSSFSSLMNGCNVCHAAADASFRVHTAESRAVLFLSQPVSHVPEARALGWHCGPHTPFLQAGSAKGLGSMATAMLQMATTRPQREWPDAVTSQPPTFLPRFRGLRGRGRGSGSST